MARNRDFWTSRDAAHAGALHWTLTACQGFEIRIFVTRPPGRATGLPLLPISLLNGMSKYSERSREDTLRYILPLLPPVNSAILLGDGGRAPNCDQDQ